MKTAVTPIRVELNGFLTNDQIDLLSGRALDRCIHRYFYRQGDVTGCPSYHLRSEEALHLLNKHQTNATSVRITAYAAGATMVELLHPEWQTTAVGRTLTEAMLRASLKCLNVHQVALSDPPAGAEAQASITMSQVVDAVFKTMEHDYRQLPSSPKEEA